MNNKEYFSKALPRFDAVILADGSFPTHELPLSVLRRAERIVCCDHALLSLLKYEPQLVEHLMALCAVDDVGDGDSMPSDVRERYSQIIHQVSEQDDNDLTKATRFLLSVVKPNKRKLRVAYIGATGKREDHTIGNISLMDFYRHNFAIEPVMLTDWGFFTVHDGNSELQTFSRQQMSIFNITCKSLSSNGLEWQAFAYEQLWQGTLNNCLGSRVSFNADGRYMVYRTYDAKK